MAGTTVSCSIKANDDNNLFEYTGCFFIVFVGISEMLFMHIN